MENSCDQALTQSVMMTMWVSHVPFLFSDRKIIWFSYQNQNSQEVSEKNEMFQEDYE